MCIRDSSYNVSLWAWDNDNNLSNNAANPAPVITVTAAQANDTTPPVVTFTTGLNQTVGTRNLTGGVTDDISGVDRMRVLVRNQQTGNYWNGTSWQAGWVWNTPTLNANTWTLPSVNLTPAGSYIVQLWAWDNEDNRSNNVANPQPVIAVQ